MEFNEKNHLASLTINAKSIILNDPLISQLFNIVCQNEDPPYAGSFEHYLNYNTTENVEELLEEKDFADLSIKEKTEIYRQRLVEELIGYIDPQIEYNDIWG